MVRLIAIALATTALVVACDKVPLTSPTGSTIVLSIDKGILPVNGQATVIAVVTESAGTPVHNGTTVTFQTSLGRIEPIEAQTLNGKASVTFHAGAQSGTAAIHAFSGSARTGSGNSTAGGVSVLVGSAAAGSLSLNVVPATVPPSGGTVTVSARVLDTTNNPLPNVSVGFTTELGTLGSTSAFTDSEGIAQTTLTTSRATKVVARIGAVTPAEFSIAVATAPTVTFSAFSPTSPTAGSAVSFTLTPSTAATALPIQSLVVDFGDGSSQTFNGVTGPVGVTHVYSREGGYTITATATDISGVRGVSSQAIVIGFPALPTISAFSASPNPVPNTANGVTTFTITAAAASGGPPVRSVQVRLNTGTVIFSGTGSGSFVYQFPTYAGGGSTLYTVTATVTDALGNTTTSSIVVSVANP